MLPAPCMHVQFSKVEVNGPNTVPLFSFLKKNARGALNTEDLKWNFQKFLVGRDGKPLMRYSPLTKPNEIEKDIEDALSARARL